MKVFEGNQLINTREVAKRIGVKPSTVRGWVSQDVIPSIKVIQGNGGTVRFDPGELNQWLKRQARFKGVKKENKGVNHEIF